MKFFMERLQIKQEETMAFGDAHNDLDMIAYAGVGVVMGNGCKELKEIGDYITDSVENEGVVKALKHFQLL
ncbi:MAG: HAD hydrolase family protein [Lachnospiraceae bacterium]|nr:HAD hydrolase family protein [Lachnospiraceae bacterium]